MRAAQLTLMVIAALALSACDEGNITGLRSDPKGMHMDGCGTGPCPPLNPTPTDSLQSE